VPDMLQGNAMAMESIFNQVSRELSEMREKSFVLVPLHSWESLNCSVQTFQETIRQKEDEIASLDLRIKTLLERG